MIRGTFPGSEVTKGCKNCAIFGLRCTIFEICMLEGDYVVRTVAGGLSVGPGSTVHVCGLTAVVVWVSGYTTPVCLLIVRGPACIWSRRVSHVSTAVSATWVVYTQQTRRRVGGAPSAHVSTLVCLWSLTNRRAETAMLPPCLEVRFYSTFYL